MLSDLPRDLAEEVLCKLPVTSLRGVRSTCKKWNSLSKDGIFKRRHIGEAKKKQRTEYHQVVMLLNYRISLFSVNLLNPSIERVGQLISLKDADRVDICNIFHCNGLLLCTTKAKSKIVVWNPCSGETKWLRPRDTFSAWDMYSLGYETNKDTYSHKVLRFVDSYDSRRIPLRREFEIYSFNSNSWKVLDVNLDWDIEYVHRGLSLHGNTYWFARDKTFPLGGDYSYFLLCFDFTTEKFGPRLSLPFHPFLQDNVALSSVRENQIAVLFQKIVVPYTLEIWISSKIEPNAVSWNHKSLLKVDMKPLIGFDFCYMGASFFVDEKKKVVVVVDKNRHPRPTRNIAYFIGKKGYFKQVDLGESKREIYWPLLSSYVPSSVQIEQTAPQGNQKTA